MPFEFKVWLAQKLGREERSQVRIAPAARKPVEPYHAVSIKPGAQSCEGAHQLSKKRFLSAKAPRLPLPDCTANSCTCSYVHHADRRSGHDRRIGENWRRGPRAGIERRERKQGRRATDALK